jgi:ligand-binding sensor domain-containing protein
MKNLITCIYFLFTVLTSIYPQNPEWIVYNTSNSVLPSNSLYPISIDENNTKWIGTGQNGNTVLVKIDNSDWSVLNVGVPIYYYFNEIAREGNGDKWIGGGDGLVGGDGLIKFDDMSWTVYNTFNSGLPSDIIYSIAIDSSGNKWIGTHEGGLAKFDDTNWTVFLPNNNITCITIDAAGNKWIGTGQNGLVMFDDTNWTVYNTSNSGLPSNLITCMTIDAAGNKWIGTEGGGLALFDDTNWTVYNTSNSGLPTNSFYSLTADENGNIWIATYDFGLVKFNRTDWIVFNSSNSGLPINTISDIAIDKNENVWIATYGGGLAVYKEGGVVSVDDKDLITPATFELEQNYPNPFNPSTMIKYSIPSSEFVTLKVYDVLGNEVATLVNEEKPAGTYEVKFDAAGLSSGIYFDKLQAGSLVETKKMILMK